MSTETLTQTRAQTKTPPRYKVLLLNDDYTPMDFVVLVLVRYFHKSEDEANHVMLTAHQNGVCVAGVYVFEVAETKVAQVEKAASEAGYPLQCALEPD
ncbi:ATP-dependent Clp protease adapter ClpS [soil metagenome]